MSKGYVIAIRDRLTDPAEMQAYAEKVGTTFTTPMTPLVANGRAETVEGLRADGVVILEFDSYDDAKAWYDSPAYTEVKAHRLKGAEYRLIVAEGV